jgi:hypothetical protein
MRGRDPNLSQDLWNGCLGRHLCHLCEKGHLCPRAVSYIRATGRHQWQATSCMDGHVIYARNVTYVERAALPG